MEGNRPFRKYPVAIGKQGTPSPIGEWKIIDKDYDWGGAFGVRWMGLNTPWGNYGIHGTNNPWSIGSPVSAGCIRMFNEDVLQIFEWVSVGTRVKIHAPLTWLERFLLPHPEKRVMWPGCRLCTTPAKRSGF